MVDHIQIKNKKATINPINDYDKCFQDAATVTLNHEEIVKKSQRSSKISFLSINSAGKKLITHQKKMTGKGSRKNNSLMLSVAEADAIVDNGLANSSMDQLIYLTKL